jgi:mRNA-degrading endonuclease YafQ of YafQ-DinJ toxin-antitoxin module
MTRLTANDLKTRGVAAIEAVLTTQPEATISVRGKDRYVVMEVAQYHYLRECELEAALAQSRADVAAGRYVQESAQDHVARLESMLAADGKATPARGKAKVKAKAASRRAWRQGAAVAYQLLFTDDYTRRALRFLKRHPELKAQYGKTLALLQVNPHHPSLRLHALAGKLQGLHSVSINLSYRITLELLIQDQQIIPVNVSDHDAVY